MILEKRQSLWLRLISQLVWWIPGRPAAKMAGFSHTEQGSGLDMLAACEHPPRRELRAKYYQHALDELKHAQLFRERARALSPTMSRAQAVLEDGGFIRDHGIRSSVPLAESLGEVEFLAFVWIHERQGARQFDIYADLMKDDAASQRMFEEIAKDERFHIAYSRRELDQMVKAGRQKDVRWAIFRVQARRASQAWLRFGRVIGDTMAGLWLSLLYGLVMGPFSLVARAKEPMAGGFHAPDEDLRQPVARALEAG